MPPTEPNAALLHERVLAASLCGIYVYDLVEGCNDFINEQYTRITGWTLDDLNGMDADTFATLFHPDDISAVFAHMGEVAASTDDQIFEVEYRFRRKSGGWVWCLSRDTVFDRAPDGSVRRFIGTFVDVTRRRTLEEREHATIESAPMAMLLVDADGVVRMANLEAERVFGWERGHLLGVEVERLVPTRARAGHPGHRASYLRAPEARRMGTGRELFALRHDGTEFPVEVGLSPVVTSEGSFTLCAVADITERRALEQERARLTDDLQQANRALAQSNEDLELFASFAAHDLQAPARQVRGLVRLLQDELGSSLEGEALEWMRQTDMAAERMQTLIRDLLTYARIDDNRPMESVDLSRCMADALHMLRDIIEADGATVVAHELPVVTGRRSQLTQLLCNLVGNAIKYRGEEPAEVDVSCRETPDGWHVSVRDDGIGIEPRFHQRIFEPFRRLHGVGTYSGSGVGLALCRRVVQAHGGTIWVESSEGSGSTFHVSFPRRTDPATESA